MLNELEAFREALGRRADDVRSEPALRLAGPVTEELRTSDGATEECSRISRSSGVQLRYYDGELGAVIINTRPTPTYAAYPRPDALFHTLAGDATRPQVREVFGEPVWSAPNSDRFECEDCRVQFQYDADGRTILVVLLVPDAP